MRQFEQKSGTVAEEFNQLALRIPNRTAIICHQKSWTFEQLRQFVNRVSNVFYSRGYRKNERIALFMDSRREFIGMWLGLSRIGLVPALINSKIKHQWLVHSLHIVDCQTLVYSSELADGELIHNKNLN